MELLSSGSSLEFLLVLILMIDLERSGTNFMKKLLHTDIKDIS